MYRGGGRNRDADRMKGLALTAEVLGPRDGGEAGRCEDLKKRLANNVGRKAMLTEVDFVARIEYEL